LSASSALERRAAARVLALSALLAAACASIAPTPAPSGPPPGPYTAPAPQTRPAPPPANVNLQGFPVEYREGYADGCRSASGGEKKDAVRFRSDGQYRTGWQDGFAICRKS
jgi:hypothetical protein